METIVGAQTLEQIVDSLDELTPEQKKILPPLPRRRGKRKRRPYPIVADYILEVYEQFKEKEGILLSNNFFADKFDCTEGNIKVALTKAPDKEKRKQRSTYLNLAALAHARATHKENRLLSDNFTESQLIAAHMTENWYRHIIFHEPLTTNKEFGTLYDKFPHGISALSAKYMNAEERAARTLELNRMKVNTNFKLDDEKTVKRKYSHLQKCRNSLSQKAKRKISVAGMKAQKLCRELNGIVYFSKEEAACGEMLQRYVPNFIILPKINYQVPIESRKGGKTVDFMIDHGFEHLYLEWHRVKLGAPRGYAGHEFASDEEHDIFWTERNKLPLQKRNEYIAETREKLRERYRTERLEILLQRDPLGKLVVCSTSAELYAFLDTHIWPDGLVNERGERIGHALPPLKRFEQDFERLKAKTKGVPRQELFSYLKRQTELTLEENAA